MTDMARPREAVGPLIRGLLVLRCLAEAGGRGSARELVRQTRLARATVDRVLLTLERLGYVRVETRDVALAPRVMELGNAYLSACRLPELLGPLTDGLADELDESVSITVPDVAGPGVAGPGVAVPGIAVPGGQGVRSVREATRRRAMSVSLRVGELLPGEPGGSGALLADRLEPGLIAVAMPVLDANRRVVCAVNVISHTSRHSAESLNAAVMPHLRRTVALMETRLTTPPGRRSGTGERMEVASRVRACKEELGAEFLESLARGLSVLVALAEPRSLSAVAEVTGLARATARRSLITLAHLGYVAADDGIFRPTPRVLELGFGCLAGATLPEIAQSHLAALVGRVKESASMAVLTGDDIQYIARVPTVRIMSVDITLGTRFPAHATSMGRVLLSGLSQAERASRLVDMDLRALTSRTVTSSARLIRLLDRVGRDGYCLVEGELEDGLRSVAVPVHDRDGRVIAAINVAMHASRRTADEARESVLPELRETAARIEDDLHVAGRFVEIRAS